MERHRLVRSSPPSVPFLFPPFSQLQQLPELRLGQAREAAPPDPAGGAVKGDLPERRKLRIPSLSLHFVLLSPSSLSNLSLLFSLDLLSLVYLPPCCFPVTGADLPTLFRSSEACVSSRSIADAPPRPSSRLAVLCALMSASASPEERYSSVLALLAAASRSCLWPLKRRKPKGLGGGLGLGSFEEVEEVKGVSVAVVNVDSVSPNASLFLFRLFVFYVIQIKVSLALGRQSRISLASVKGAP